MKGKIVLITFLSLFIIFSVIGCITNQSPSTSETIVISEQNPEQIFSVKGAGTIEWKLDGVLIQTDKIGRDENSYLTLSFENLSAGEHKLGVEDDESRGSPWTIFVSGSVSKIKKGDGLNNEPEIEESWKERMTYWEELMIERMKEK